MRIGIAELIVIGIIIIAVIKPEKLKVYASNIGKAIRIIREENEKLNKNVVEPVKEAAKPITEPIKEVVEPLNDIKNEINDTVNDIKPKVNLRKRG